MHWNVEQILWALVLAAHLVLLIVLLGRDRASRYKWFTAYIALSTVRLLADHLLHGKLTAIAFYWQSYVISILCSILGVLVLVELARRVFSSGRGGLILKPSGWIGAIMVSIALGATVLWFWGQWPAWSVLKAQPELFALRLVWLSALKLELLVGVLSVETMLFLQIFGRRFGFPWTSHPQQIAVGLSTAAISQFSVEAITDSIKRSVHLTTREQYDHVLRLLTNLEYARFAVVFLVVVWWIAWLWRDEPGATVSVPVPDTTDAMEIAPPKEDPGPSPETDVPDTEIPR